MIDWHSHILPAMDDGSKNIAESIAMLKMLSEQHVDTVVATPHFYANNESAETFFERRQRSFEKLKDAFGDSETRILLGAEVRYYQGISRMSDIKRFCIEDSGILLLEMSNSKWTEYVIRELLELAGSREITLVIAHIDRYMKYQSKETLQRILESDIFLQANASFFSDFFTRRRAVHMLERGEIRFIGSDCHGAKRRPPAIGEAFDIIEKRLGKNFLCRLDQYEHSVLKYF